MNTKVYMIEFHNAAEGTTEVIAILDSMEKANNYLLQAKDNWERGDEDINGILPLDCNFVTYKENDRIFLDVRKNTEGYFGEYTYIIKEVELNKSFRHDYKGNIDYMDK